MLWQGGQEEEEFEEMRICLARRLADEAAHAGRLELTYKPSLFPHPPILFSLPCGTPYSLPHFPLWRIPSHPCAVFIAYCAPSPLPIPTPHLSEDGRSRPARLELMQIYNEEKKEA